MDAFVVCYLFWVVLCFEGFSPGVMEVLAERGTWEKLVCFAGYELMMTLSGIYHVHRGVMENIDDLTFVF